VQDVGEVFLGVLSEEVEGVRDMIREGGGGDV